MFTLYLHNTETKVLLIPSGGQRTYLTREGIRAVMDSENYFEYAYATGFKIRSKDMAFKFN